MSRPTYGYCITAAAAAAAAADVDNVIDDNLLKYRFIYVVTVLITVSISDIFCIQKIKVERFARKNHVKKY
jgi:hypothetical protein